MNEPYVSIFLGIICLGAIILEWRLGSLSGLKDFHWYRKRMGGEWYLVTHKRISSVGPYWVRPKEYERYGGEEDFRILEKEGA